MSNETLTNEPSYELTRGEEVDIKSWTRGVAFEDEARAQYPDSADAPGLRDHRPRLVLSA